MGDSCSAACESVNDAARFFNILQVAPGCVSTTLRASDKAEIGISAVVHDGGLPASRQYFQSNYSHYG